RSAATKRVLAGLFHTAYLYASKLCGYTHAVIEVNPRHVAFYGKELGFNPIGTERLNTRVNAPAVLLALRSSRLPRDLQPTRASTLRRAPSGSSFTMGFRPKRSEGFSSDSL